jgi:hypothetical protein
MGRGFRCLINYRYCLIMNRYYIAAHSEVLGHENNCPLICKWGLSITVLKFDSPKDALHFFLTLLLEDFIFSIETQI